MNALEFIKNNIDKTTRVHTLPPVGEKDLIGLPFPFTSPCIDGIFQEMYYWDTYFTNRGFYLLDKGEQAVNNVRDFLFLLNAYGKVPNGNRMDYLSRSQPPFLGLMLQDALAFGKGEISKKEAFAGLEKEYEFWQTKRGCENGLNAYNTDLPQEILQDPMHVEGYASRTGRKLENTEENAKNVLAECESGWDFSPRFSAKCIWHNPVDLNCLLYKNERLLASWASELGEKEKAEFYKSAAKKRKEKLQKYCKKDGLYFDYNYKEHTLSPVLSCASLFPYFVGLDEDKEGFKRALSRLERQFGLVACDSEEHNYQWSAPNAWAPLQFVAFFGAKTLGLHEEAKRIAQKYVCATNALFEKTGQLWEKYNAQTGEIDALSEYGTPAMLGWSAGVFVEFSAYLEDVKNQEN